MENTDLEKAVNDSSRKVRIRGKVAIVPHKFDANGFPVTSETPKEDWIYSRLNQNDLKFLAVWKETGHSESVDLVSSKTGLSYKEAARLIKKLAWIKLERAEIKVLADIPTVDWIKAKHVKSIESPESEKLADSDHKSLSELAKIEGAYKNNLNVSVTQNVFNLPKLDPATEAKLKQIAKQEAQIIQEAQVVNG